MDNETLCKILFVFQLILTIYGIVYIISILKVKKICEENLKDMEKYINYFKIKAETYNNEVFKFARLNEEL